jgi:hypothetical protein
MLRTADGWDGPLPTVVTPPFPHTPRSPRPTHSSSIHTYRTSAPCAPCGVPGASRATERSKNVRTDNTIIQLADPPPLRRQGIHPHTAYRRGTPSAHVQASAVKSPLTHLSHLDCLCRTLQGIMGMSPSAQKKKKKKKVNISRRRPMAPGQVAPLLRLRESHNY